MLTPFVKTQSKWANFIQQAGSQRIVELSNLNLLTVASGVSQHIMHYLVDDDFVVHGVRFATPRTRTAVLKEMTIQDVARVRSFVTASSHKSHDRITGAMYGQCFEHLVHQWFISRSRGTRLVCRRLGVWLPAAIDANNTVTAQALLHDDRARKLHVNIPVLPPVPQAQPDPEQDPFAPVWKTLSNLQFRHSRYDSQVWSPSSLSEAAVDLVFMRGVQRLPPRKMRIMPVQVTVSTKHPFKASAMAELLRALDEEAGAPSMGMGTPSPASIAETYTVPRSRPRRTLPRHELFFFVPPEVFPRFELQPAHVAGSDRVFQGPAYPTSLRNLVQWVVCMDVSKT